MHTCFFCDELTHGRLRAFDRRIGACADCRHLAGAPGRSGLYSAYDLVPVVLAAFERAHAKLLQVPVWEADELDEMDGRLREHIERVADARWIALARSKAIQRRNQD